jgi:hypothetical protein
MSMNGERRGQLTVTERPVVVAEVDIQVRAPGHPKGEEEVHASLSGAVDQPLAVGDEVLIRALRRVGRCASARRPKRQRAYSA